LINDEQGDRSVAQAKRTHGFEGFSSVGRRKDAIAVSETGAQIPFD
jgi:hypothetical protein